MNNHIRYQKTSYNNSVQSEGRAMLRGSCPAAAGFWHIRAVARILFQPRQRGEPGSGGGPGAPGQGLKPLWSWKLFSS